MRPAPTTMTEIARVRAAARDIGATNKAAAAIIDAALVEHGASRHPLVDVLLDIRSVLRRDAP